MTVAVSKDPGRIAGMFDAIAHRYDTLNHLLSAGLDRRWRRRAVAALHLTGSERVLDVCTGTGDLALEAATSRVGRAAEVIGIDFSREMLRLAASKIREAGLSDRVHVARGDATAMPLPSASVDVAMVAFGIRNVLDPSAACAEFYRVLRPGGRVAILEFGAPTLPGLRHLYLWYFKRVLPRIGALVSRHGHAYSYLPTSVMDFPCGWAFAEALDRAGFRRVHVKPMTFGVVYLYLADRPPSTGRGSLGTR